MFVPNPEVPTCCAVVILLAGRFLFSSRIADHFVIILTLLRQSGVNE